MERLVYEGLDFYCYETPMGTYITIPVVYNEYSGFGKTKKEALAMAFSETISGEKKKVKVEIDINDPEWVIISATD